MIRLAVVTPIPALRVGLREVLGSLPDVEVVAEAARPQGLPPVDVLVLASAESLRELDQETPAVLLLTDRPEEAAELADFPVWGLLPPDADEQELAAALHALSEGLWVGSPALARQLRERRPVPDAEQAGLVADPLTERERQVLQLLAEGLANKQIAASLDISEHTVKFHLSSLYAKLGATSRTEAVRRGVRRGWVIL